MAPAALMAAFSSGFMVNVNEFQRINYSLVVSVECTVTTKYTMEEIKYVPLQQFQIEPTIDDKFWLEKVKRSIQDCNSVSALKEMATLLAQIATNRQGVIRGLVQDMFIFNNVAINQDDIANPPIKTQSET